MTGDEHLKPEFIVVTWDSAPGIQYIHIYSWYTINIVAILNFQVLKAKWRL